MILGLIGFVILGFLLLRFNAYLERRLQARRILHALVVPLNSYLNLLDHELQSDEYEADRLVRQAVLDHVTELRAFLLQPRSKDLVIGKPWPWLQPLNNLLLSLEEALEDSLGDIEETNETGISEQVRSLSLFLSQNKVLSKLARAPVGVVSAE